MTAEGAGSAWRRARRRGSGASCTSSSGHILKGRLRKRYLPRSATLVWRQRGGRSGQRACVPGDERDGSLPPQRRLLQRRCLRPQALFEARAALAAQRPEEAQAGRQAAARSCGAVLARLLARLGLARRDAAGAGARRQAGEQRSGRGQPHRLRPLSHPRSATPGLGDKVGEERTEENGLGRQVCVPDRPPIPPLGCLFSFFLSFPAAASMACQWRAPPHSLLSSALQDAHRMPLACPAPKANR